MSKYVDPNYSTPVQASYHTDDTDIYSRNDSYTAFLTDVSVHDHRVGKGLGSGRITLTPIASTANAGEIQTITGGLVISDGMTQNTILDPGANGFPFLKVTGLTGATAASRYVGGTVSGAPASGTFQTGDFVVDQAGAFWVCTSGGTSGSWVRVGGQPSGTVTLYGGSTDPLGGLLCDGRSLARAGTYASLFAVIGTAYGAVDGTHFSIPDLRGRTAFGPDNMGTATGAAGIFTTNNALGNKSGEYAHALTAAESGTAAHAHGPGTFVAGPHTHTENKQPTATAAGGGATVSAIDDGTGIQTGAATPAVTGTSANAAAANAASAHNTIPLNTILNYVIWA